MSLAIATPAFLAVDGILLTSNSLSLPDDTSMAQYCAYVDSMQQVQDRDRWFIGDLIREGERLHPEFFEQAWPDYSVTSLLQYRRVADLVPAELRHQDIPWSWFRLIPTRLRGKFTTTEQVAYLVQGATTAPYWDYRRWVEEVNALKGETNKATRKRDIDGAIDYARRHEGTVWTDDDTELVTDLLRGTV